MKDLSTEAGGRGSNKKDLIHQRNTFRDIVDFLEVYNYYFLSNHSIIINSLTESVNIIDVNIRMVTSRKPQRKLAES